MNSIVTTETKSHPLVSIIIPAYNASNYLIESIRSALNQTYQNIEVIVVDDGSTDDTLVRFSEFEQLGVKCITQKNTGASSARNAGLKAASGQYVQFLDADDILHKDKISTQINKMLDHNSGLSFVLWSRFETSINESSHFIFNDVNVPKQCSGTELMISFGMENWYVPTTAWLISRSLIEKGGLWDNKRSPNDDGEFYSRMLFQEQNVLCIDQILAYYRLTGQGSLGQFNNGEDVRASIESWNKIHRFLQKNEQQKALSYPKNGFYSTCKRSFMNYPKEAKEAAGEFGEIKAECFITNDPIKNPIIKLFGLIALLRLLSVYTAFRKFLRLKN